MQQFNINQAARDPNAPRREVAPGTSAPSLGSSGRNLDSPSFWTNLKDFLTERSVKIPRGAKQEVFHNEGLDSSFGESFKAFFRATPRFKNPAQTNMTVDFQPTYKVFWNNLRDLISPPKLPPLKLTSKPVPVKPLWARRDEFSWAQGISIAVHAVLVLALVGVFVHHVVEQKVNPATTDVVELSPYLSKLPPAATKAGGGGGGGQHMPDPPTKGRAPRFSMEQLAPPLAKPIPNPKLQEEATLLGPPDLKIQSNNDPNFGDPLASIINGSGGSGSGSGIGTGSGTGIGSGSGGGLGPGSGGGTGGGAYRPGSGGVGYPTCLYCPEPQYSEDARKAKYQGTVVLQVIIEADGHATNIQVVKSPGLGLEEKAIEAVKTWRFKPAVGPNGQPVRTITPIEVTFRLL